MIVHQGKTFAEAYEASLKSLFNTPQFETKPRDMCIRENTDVALIIEDPLSCLYSNPTRPSQFKYIAAEFLWYYMGRNDVAFIEKFAKFWNSIQNEDGTVNSSYGNLLFTRKNRYGLNQYEWAFKSLVNDKDSRQAIMHFNLPQHQYFGNKDFVCTMYGIFQIRDNKLNLTISMRSNDAIWGTPTDVAFFCSLLSQMHLHLLSTGLMDGLGLGTYTHIANSYHIYERHFSMVKNMLAGEFYPISLPAVDENLISTDGIYTTSMDLLFNNYSETESPIKSKIYEWLHHNINH